MGNSGISSLVLVITGLIIAALAAGVAFELANLFSEDIVTLAGIFSSQLRVDVAIISSPEYAYDAETDELTILVKNTGSEPIELGDEDNRVSTFDTFIDGAYTQPDDATAIDGAPRTWGPGEVVELTWEDEDSISTGQENTFRVVVEQNEDEFVFFAHEE